MADIASPITYNMEKKRRDVEAAKLLAAQKSLPISSTIVPQGWTPEQRSLLVPELSPDGKVVTSMGDPTLGYTSGSTGQSYDPVRGFTSVYYEGNPIPYDALHPPMVEKGQPANIATPVREAAVPASKPVGSVDQKISEAPVNPSMPSNGGINAWEVSQGPGAPTDRRFVYQGKNLVQINPESPGIVAEARRRGIGIEDTGMVPGGNVSQYSVSDPAAVEKRREEGRVAIDQLNRTLDRANIMEGAHGPKEAAKAQARIAGIDAVRTKGQAAQRNTELELAKAKVSMAKDISDIQKNQADIMKKGSFDEETDYKANLSALKDPGAAQWLTAARKNVHAGTHEWTDNSISMYDDAGESVRPVKIQGAVPKQFRDALKGTLGEYEQAKKLLEENSGLFSDTSTYRTKLLGIQDKFKQMLATYGLRVEEVKL